MNFINCFEVYDEHGELVGEINEISPDTEDVDDLEPTEVTDLLSSTTGENNTYSLPRHLRCGAHRVKLVVSGINVALNNPRRKQVNRSLMGKLCAIWSKQKRSTVVSEKIHEVLGGLFMTPNDTRWNSLYDSMVKVQQFCIEKEPQLNALFTSQDIRSLSVNEIQFLNEFIMVMCPVAMALGVVQGDVAVGYLLPTIQCMNEEWETVKAQDFRYCPGLLRTLKAEITRRFDPEMESNFFKVAAAVHPKFKLH